MLPLSGLEGGPLSLNQGHFEALSLEVARPTESRWEAWRREAERLAALRRYEVLSTSPEASFDRLTRLAARFFEVPIALVSLVGSERQWSKSCYGVDLDPIDREHSFCHYAIQNEDGMVVENAAQDPRFAEASFVAGAPHLRFYAGAPLRTAGGHMLGTFCVMDRRPRTFEPNDRTALQDWAAMAMDEMGLRRQAVTSAKAEARLRRSEQQFREIADTITQVFWVRSLEEARPVYVSPAYEEVWGRPCETFYDAPERWMETVHPEDRSRLKAVAVRDGRPRGYEVEYRIRRPDGEVRWIRDRALPAASEDGSPRRLVGVAEDITERKAAEAALRTSEERHRALVECASDIIAILGPTGMVRYASPSFQQVLGRDPESLVGENIFGPAGIHPEDADHILATVAESFEHPEAALTVQYRMQRADGHWIQLESVVRNLIEDEAIGGFIANTRDMTDSHRFKAEQEARQRAEELLRAKTSLLNNMSHELRTPLTSIIGFADVIGEKGDGILQEFAGCIARSGKRLQKTLDSVLSLARFESEEGTLNLQPVDVSAAAREAAELFRPGAEEKGLGLCVEASGEPGEGRALLDEDALRRILDNLLSNAIKFTEEGRVTVRVEADPRAVHLSIEDTGIGISEDFQAEKLFEEFAQESTGLSRTHEGSGLGLAITRRLVEAMDGRIAVASKQGEGSRFTVTFSPVEVQ